MMRSILGTALMVAALLALFATSAVAQEAFPLTVLIRGEDVWLRDEPAQNADVVAYLQRGEIVQITGSSQESGGLAYFPVTVTQTNASGWVRDLFIDPRTPEAKALLAGAAQTTPEPVPSDPVTERPERQDHERRTGRGSSDAESPAEPPLPAPEPVEEERACDPSYPDLCLHIGAADIDCSQIGSSDIRVRFPDPHDLDGDGDGVGCES